MEKHESMNGVTRLTWFVLFIITTFALCNCAPQEGMNTEGLTLEAGFGESQGYFRGVEFNFPKRIALAGNQIHTPDFCLTADSIATILLAETCETIKGTPGFGTVYMTLANSNPLRVPITCPASISFISEFDADNNPKAKNEIVVSDITISLCAASNDTFPADLYALNTDRSRPALKTSFTLGPVTQNFRLKHGIEALAPRNLRNNQSGTNWTTLSSLFGQALWTKEDGKDICKNALR